MVPDEPGRSAEPAGCLALPGSTAGRLAGSPWTSWLWAPGKLAGSELGKGGGGREQGRQQLRSPTPITAGGLSGVFVYLAAGLKGPRQKS